MSSQIHTIWTISSHSYFYFYFFFYYECLHKFTFFSFFLSEQSVFKNYIGLQLIQVELGRSDDWPDPIGHFLTHELPAVFMLAWPIMLKSENALQKAQCKDGTRDQYEEWMFSYHQAKHIICYGKYKIHTLPHYKIYNFDIYWFIRFNQWLAGSTNDHQVAQSSQ